jgi:hypothetical protein
MDATMIPPKNNRLGFHYFPDSLHYRECDLNTWLPALKSLGASWLSLVAPLDRAIPEPFLAGLLEAGIEPILHFPLADHLPTRSGSLELLFSAYAGWGVHYAVLFDRPNKRSSWPVNAWAQTELVERFLDIFIPPAENCLQAGLTPVFPPLEPGGDYWDTAFLRASLQGMLRRGRSGLLSSLVLSAYASVDERPLNWGAGGPERWPGARPYFTPQAQQDQRGFYIFDWYLAITQAVLGEARPLLLFGSGCRFSEDQLPGSPEDAVELHARANLALMRLLASSPESVPPDPSAEPFRLDHQLEPVPQPVLACNFWLLSAAPDSAQSAQAWFQPDGSPKPVTERLQNWIAKEQPGEKMKAAGPDQPEIQAELQKIVTGLDRPPANRPISHYLLLPTYEWGIADWHLEAIRPFVKKYRPTVGYSLEEAAKAARVTVIGGEQSFPAESLEKLSEAGCLVESISGDGTSIATQLAAR